jgi:hypothetical protein
VESLSHPKNRYELAVATGQSLLSFQGAGAFCSLLTQKPCQKKPAELKSSGYR